MRTTTTLALAVLLAAPQARGATAAPAAKPAPKPAARAADIAYPPLPEFRIPKPETATLPNGLTILLLPDRDLPLVEGTLMVRAGSRLEPASKVGLGSLVGTVLRTGGTAKRSGDAIDDLLEGLGARVETSVGATQGRAAFSCLSSDADAVLGLVAEIVREPAFAEAKIEIAKAQMKSGIARRNDNVSAITNREFSKLVYGKDSVYARVPEYATVDAVGRADLVAYHAAHFHPNRAFLGLTGDFDPAAARALVEKHFGSWPKGPDAAAFEGGYEADARPGVFFVQKDDVNQANVMLGHLGIRTDDPDYYAVSVLNEVFGGGFSARLFSNVRSRKGLAYSVYGFVGDEYDRPGLLRIGMQTKSSTAVAGIKALHEEIAAIVAAPPRPDEIARAKESLLNSFIFNFDSKGEILDRQLTYLFYGYPVDFLERWRAGIEKVTAEDVHAAAKRTIREGRLVQLVVGNPKDFDAPLDTLGPVTTVDVTIPPPAAGAAPAPAKPAGAGK